MRHVSIAFDHDVPEYLVIEAIKKTLSPRNIIVGQGILVNGLPEGNIYVEL